MGPVGSKVRTLKGLPGTRAMPIFENGDVKIHYEEAGDGFPLLVIPGGGLNAAIPYLSERVPFNPMEVLSDTYHCITMDIRNANSGGSSGPLDVTRPWDSHTDDQLALIKQILRALDDRDDVLG